MSERVGSFAEWAMYADGADEPRAQAVGELADQVRARLGVNKHVPVWFAEESETYSRDCDCCAPDSARWLVIRCGEIAVRLDVSYTEELDWGLGAFVSWLDEPRRAAEREAARQCVREREAAVDAALVSAFSRVQVDLSSPSWHSDMLRQLGIPE